MANWKDEASNAIHGELKNWDRGSKLAHKVLDIITPVIDAQMAEANQLDEVIEKYIVQAQEDKQTILELRTEVDTLREAIRTYERGLEYIKAISHEPKPFVDDRGRTVRFNRYPSMGLAREIYSPETGKWFHEAWVE